MTSVLSLAVEDRAMIVRIDGNDVSRADGNGGPDPWHVLVPVNRFVATDQPTTATIACCPSCGPDCFAIVAPVMTRCGRFGGSCGGSRGTGRRVTRKVP